MFTDTGKALIIFGIVAIVAGILITMLQKNEIPGFMRWFGNLPLDIRIVRDNYRLYLPFGTSIVLSVIVSFILFLINKFFR